jgi:hypothetical protein
MVRIIYALLLVLLFFPLSSEAGVVRRTSGTLKVNSSNVSHPEPGLMGLWTFDGGSLTASNVLDKSGGNLAGTLNSFTAVKTYPGKRGQALVFDGSDDNVSFGDVAEAQNITLAAWVRPSAVKTGMKIVSKKMGGASSQYGLGTSLTDANKFTAVFYSSAPSFDVCDSQGAAGTYEANKWYFVVGTYDGDFCKIYVNGVDATNVISDDASGFLLNTTSELRIGADGGASIAAGSYFQGAIDEVRIYSYAMTGAEVAKLYGINAGGLNANSSKNDRVKNGLVGLWSFDGPTMLRNVADSSGQENHGSMLGFTSTSSAVTPGKIGQGLRIDGDNDTVNTTAVSSSLIGTGALTYAAWVKPSRVITSRIISDGKTELFINSSLSRFSFSNDGNATRVSAANNSVVTNTWTHVAATRTSGGIVNLYVNGVLSGTANQDAGANQSSAFTIRIGNNPAVSGSFPGVMDDVRIYNRELSATEIKNLYNLGR